MANFDINAVLDSIKARHDLKSDYKLALFLGITDGSVRNFRHGRSLPDERICKIIAHAAQVDPLVLAAQVQAQRSKTEDARTMWQAIAERLQMAAHGAAAAIFAVVFAMGFVAGDARAASAGDVHASESVDSKVYTSHLVGWALLFAALAWLVSRSDPGFTPCFVPAK